MENNVPSGRIGLGTPQHAAAKPSRLRMISILDLDSWSMDRLGRHQRLAQRPPEARLSGSRLCVSLPRWRSSTRCPRVDRRPGVAAPVEGIEGEHPFASHG